MSSQNIMAKRKFALQNHIVWLCSIFITQSISSCTTPMTSQAIDSYFCSQIFSTFTQYMSVSHGYSTIGGIEYGGCGEDKKKEIVSHQLGVSTGYGDAHQ